MSHGAVIVTASPDRSVDNQPVARLGDTVSCPIHGTNSIVSVTTTTETDNRPNAHITALAACGAEILTGSSDCYVG